MYQLRSMGARPWCGGHGSRCWRGPPHARHSYGPFTRSSEHDFWDWSRAGAAVNGRTTSTGSSSTR